MTTRRPLIAGNWKMYKNYNQAFEYAKGLSHLASAINDIDIMIAPSFPFLFHLSEILKDSNIMLGSQNLYYEKEGAFTGEVSSEMLISCGCKFVIIGHSERRVIFGETDAIVNKKIIAAISAGLIPILCVGESAVQREADNTFNILDKQIEIGLEGIPLNDLQNLIIAYEPIWAIGTGKTATNEQAQEVHSFLRKKIEKKFGNKLAQSLKILYGGSVNPGNISGLMEMADIDGALVGGASLDADIFSKILKYNR